VGTVCCPLTFMLLGEAQGLGKRESSGVHSNRSGLWRNNEPVPKPPSKPLDEHEKYPPEEAWERMNRALRGAKIAGPRPLKDKPKLRGKREPRGPKE
jgi:hypothetical protein